jgi:uracil-DNA glycosylase
MSDTHTAALPATSAAPLALDARQRSMLSAMGIHLWEAPFYEEKQAATQVKSAQAAIKNIVITEAAVAVTSAPTPVPAHAAAAHAAALHASQPTSASTNALASESSATSTARTSALGTAAAPASAAPRAGANTAVPALSARQPLPPGIASMDWLQLQTAVQSCQACNLCESRKNTVFGVGQPSTDAALAPRADWLIVGEAPGENEDLKGEPFVGQAGKLLDNMLRAMVVNGQPLARHSNVFIANVLKCRPPANRNPSADEVAMCQPYLLRQIALLQPKIILAMGRFAVQALTGSAEPLGKLRGRVHALSFGDYQAPVIVTYHPAYLLRNLPDKSKAWADLLLAMQTLHGE